jgi:3-oxoacyl-[acyl-carrier protein] reductase
MNLGLTGKITLISGANNPQGIGAATALAFAREGAKIALLYKKLDFEYNDAKTGNEGIDRYHKAVSGNADAVVEQLHEMDCEPLVVEGDISDTQSVKATFDMVEDTFGKVEILINNAAMYAENDTTLTLDGIGIDQTLNVNIKGTLLMSHEFVKRRGDYGRIINISTDAAQVFPGQITYGASKAAVEALTRSMAIEAGRFGITVNCIAPGPTQTGWIDGDLEKSVLSQIPLGKLIEPADIANAILFLASEQARFITGQIIKVSGGHAL